MWCRSRALLLYNYLSHEEKRKFEFGGPKEVFLKCPWIKCHKMVEVETGYVLPAL